MLNFKYASLFLLQIMFIIVLSGLYFTIPLWIFLIPTGLYAMLLIHGSCFIGSHFFMPVVCKAEEPDNAVAITFDDGPAPGTTDQILDILKKNNVKAAFFCIGERVVENPELIKRISDEGHLIGNHSYSHHFFFDLFSYNNMVREIRNTNKAIEKIVSKRIHLFRPPYGVTTPVLAKAVKKAKMTSVGWSLRSFDTITKTPGKLVDTIDRKIKAGDVILLHDTIDVTVNSLQPILDNIKSKGLTIVPVDKLLNINAYV